MNAQRESFELDDDLKALDAKLRQALPMGAPTGLVDRIYQATADDLPGAEAPAVVARIGPRIMRWASMAAAAAIIIGVSAAVWLGTQPQTTDDAAVARMNQDIETIAVALDTSSTDLGEELDTLQADLDTLAVALGGTDSSNIDTDSLAEDLWEMGQQLGQF